MYHSLLQPLHEDIENQNVPDGTCVKRVVLGLTTFLPRDFCLNGQNGSKLKIA